MLLFLYLQGQAEDNWASELGSSLDHPPWVLERVSRAGFVEPSPNGSRTLRASREIADETTA
jgi:hypothetical protein